MCHLVARGIYIRWQHLILLFIYIVQLYKEDWGILRMLGCRAVALPSEVDDEHDIGNLSDGSRKSLEWDDQANNNLSFTFHQWVVDTFIL